MLRFRALNQESSDESEGEEDTPAVTREAQEQEAFRHYKSALVSLRDKKIDEAKSFLKDILDCGVLPDVETEEINGHPLAVLKYSCLKNMGSVLVQEKDFSGALSYYIQASKLDSSDVMLWYHIGSVASELQHYELSRDAFLEALNISPKNWECLNSLIMILFVLRDYILCLVFISRAFELDPTFIKGYIIRDAILREDPDLLSSTYLEKIDLGPKHIEYEKEIADEILNEAKKLRTAKHKNKDEVILKPVPLDEPVVSKTWISLGKSLIVQHKRQRESLVTRLDLLHDPGKGNVSREELELEFDKEPCIENISPAKNMPCSGTDSEIPSEEVEGAQDNDDCKGRKRRRNSLSYMPQWVWGGKRRSARVRSTVRREAEREECNLEETLHRIIPYNLFPSTEKVKDMDNMKSNDDSMDTMDLYKLFENRETVEGRDEKNPEQRIEGEAALQSGGYFGSEAEQLDVTQFLNIHNYCDLIDLLVFYLRELNRRWQLTWPKELTYVYMEAYKLMRLHVPFPDILCLTETLDWIFKDGCLTLLFEELSLDYWLKEKINNQKNDRTTEKRPVPHESIGYLELVLSRFPKEHVLRSRTYWIKAHGHLSDGNVEMATSCLDLLIQHLECGMSDEKIVTLKNCCHNNIISKDTAQHLLTALFRNQNLCEVQYLYESKRFEELTEILKETFSYNQHLGLLTSYNPVNDCPDRASQLAMLMDAFWQLKRYQECFYWGEACCNEALHKYLNSEEKEQQKWANILEKLLSGMESCVRKAGLSVVDNSRLSRLIPNLIRIVCHQLEAPDNMISMPIECVSPWILFQQILEREDEKGRAVPPEEEDDLPAYMNILFIAHEFLSRRSWCCSNEGALLLHTMDVVIPRMHRVEKLGAYNKLVQGMEQIVFCLYAHPNKKTKLRSPLQDHGVPPVGLTWEHSIRLFQFYLPRELPEFDSLRAVSITADVEVILKRIIGLVPAECNPGLRHLVNCEENIGRKHIISADVLQ